MPKLSAQQLKQRQRWVRKVLQHHLHAKGVKMHFKPAGLTNSVFEVSASGKNYIVRIGESPSKLQDFHKEQWVTRKARASGVPVAAILTVGHKIISHPYMIQRAVAGDIALNHPRANDILRSLGQYAAKLHRIPTRGFGKNFDWSDDDHAKNKRWKDFLFTEIKIQERLAWLTKHNMLGAGQLKRLDIGVKKIMAMKSVETHLAHGDLRLKNVIVDKKGRIRAILDWEASLSTAAPLWDLAIALHDLSIDQKEAFLRGYGMAPQAFQKISPHIKVLNTLLYTDALAALERENKTELLNFYRLRLNGYLDVYFSEK